MDAKAMTFWWTIEEYREDVLRMDWVTSKDSAA